MNVTKVSSAAQHAARVSEPASVSAGGLVVRQRDTNGMRSDQLGLGPRQLRLISRSTFFGSSITS